ncbi:MAG: aminodeoxychorismate lyase [Woeseiaceae bacterium]
MSQWFRNGESLSQVSIDDRAFQYGDGLFETVAIRDGRPRLWNYHLERLQLGCEKLRLLKPANEALRASLDLAIRASDADRSHCTAKIILSAGISARGYARSAAASGTEFVGVFSSQALAAEHYREGVDTMLCDTRLAIFSATAGCKTLNRLEQVLARLEIAPGEAFEGFTLDAEGRVICGTMSNVFIVTANTIATPSLDRCGVAGVMRRHTIETLRQTGDTVMIRDISESELMHSDEVFICNSQFGILPVRRCGDKVWHAHTRTRSVMRALASSGIAECTQ